MKIKNADEWVYYIYRIIKGCCFSLLMRLCCIVPVKPNKIVVCCHKGSRGYGCSPKYIVENLLQDGNEYKIIWLVKDMNKDFPKGIKRVRYTAFTSAYHLATANVWIDNDKKELGTIKRKGQFYIHTWHGPVGFKTCGALRGSSWSKLGQRISLKDSAMTDMYLSNSDWCSRTHREAFLYTDEVIYKTGMPRTDILMRADKGDRERIRLRHHLPQDIKIAIYAPTFRGGIQKKKRRYHMMQTEMDLNELRKVLQERFGGEWRIMIRLHPLLAETVKEYPLAKKYPNVADISQQDDLYEYIAAADVLISDYSSCAFDASYKRMPVFLYAEDYHAFETERAFYWKREELPFSIAESFEQLRRDIMNFDEAEYQKGLDTFFERIGLCEKGDASQKVGDAIRRHIYE